MTLIGRDAELAVVRAHLHVGKSLAITGPEGVGKTALVQAALTGSDHAVYCADTTTLKTACESLPGALGHTGARADNVARKQAVLRALRGRADTVVFDHVGRVTPKLLSLLELLHASHPLIVVTRSLAWNEIGHLKMILWDFDRLELTNLRKADACRLVGREADRLRLEAPNLTEFQHELWRLSRGNPRLIVDLCAQAANGRYVFGRHLSARLLDLDRRIAKIGRS
ncbi:MAG TPA: AAA family ATPase [Verrucomicrobiae bacterium]|nr:AAA family ATPase [Verrucomicrobiae bacterium]